MNHQEQANEEPGEGRRRLLRTAVLGFGMPTAGVLGIGAVGTFREAHAETQDRALQFVEVPPGIASLVKSADGTRISVHEYGNPNGRPVVFVHGFSQSRLSWIEQINSSKLTSAFRIVTLDLRGHGESDKPLTPYTPNDQADDIKAVLTELSISKPIFVAWSFGGSVVLDYFSKYGISNVSKVFFVDAGYGGTESATRAQLYGPALKTNTELMLSHDLGRNVRGTLDFLKACAHMPLSDSDLAFHLAHNMMATPASRAATLFGRPKVLENYDRSVLPALKAAAIPVVALTGSKDVIVLPFGAERAAAASGGMLLSYDNAGHLPFLEQKDRFNTDLWEFGTK